MTVTVTLNPALDKTAEVETLVPNGLNRLRNIIVQPGGKGINVSKTIASLGGQSVASGICAGATGEELLHLLGGTNGIWREFIKVEGNTRTNLKLVSPDGVTEFNEPGPRVAVAKFKLLQKKMMQYAGKGVLFVLSGSLPAGLPASTYGQLTKQLKSTGAEVLVDADGEALQHAIDAKPHYLKPNAQELTAHFQKPADTPTQGLLVMARQLVAAGISLVMVSRGEKGALFVSAKEALYTDAVRVKAHSAVGAGDAMVGAFCYAAQHRWPLARTAAWATACAAGAAATKGTRPPTLQRVEKLLPKVVVRIL